MFRNDCSFNGKVPSVDEVFYAVKLKSWLWLKHLLKGFKTTTFVDWESNPCEVFSY